MVFERIQSLLKKEFALGVRPPKAERTRMSENTMSADIYGIYKSSRLTDLPPDLFDEPFKLHPVLPRHLSSAESVLFIHRYEFLDLPVHA
jgi:hypothetical protein